MRREEFLFSDKKSQILIGAMNLASEAGEVVNIIKKQLLHDHLEDKDKIKEELGDCIWAIAVLADAYGIGMDEIMESNINKLKKRYPEGFSAEKSINRKE